MFEQFTERARKVVAYAQEESRRANHGSIGTGHILLGLLRDPGAAGPALESLGISPEVVRQRLPESAGDGKGARSGRIPFTPQAGRALELSRRESLQLGHSYVGCEHILLGLIREGEGTAATVLTGLGADLNQVRLQVVQVVRESLGTEAGQTASPLSSGQPALELEQIGGRLGEIIDRLDEIGDRLSAIERYLGMGGGPRTGE